ncbi:hypothetical protein Syun_016886 [Stephania yunnanensis]|uniref:Uncharacterized protein n=1 Tax=Stephania yunnanensis TaxID=152371 RepID=A0AAP0J615_9MAGN
MDSWFLESYHTHGSLHPEIKKTNSTLKLSTILREDRIFFNWKVDHNSQHGNTTMTPSTTSTTTNTHLIWLFISIFSV